MCIRKKFVPDESYKGKMGLAVCKTHFLYQHKHLKAFGRDKPVLSAPGGECEEETRHNLCCAWDKARCNLLQIFRSWVESSLTYARILARFSLVNLLVALGCIRRSEYSSVSPDLSETIRIDQKLEANSQGFTDLRKRYVSSSRRRENPLRLQHPYLVLFCNRCA